MMVFCLFPSLLQYFISLFSSNSHQHHIITANFILLLPPNNKAPPPSSFLLLYPTPKNHHQISIRHLDPLTASSTRRLFLHITCPLRIFFPSFHSSQVVLKMQTSTLGLWLECKSSKFVWLRI